MVVSKDNPLSSSAVRRAFGISSRQPVLRTPQNRLPLSVLSDKSTSGQFASFASAKKIMLHCNMKTFGASLQLGLEDLLGNLQFARRSGDLGRLAWLAYCEVQHWARVAGEQKLAKHSSEIITHIPHASREEFMAEVDELIVELEEAHFRIAGGVRTGTVDTH